MTVKLRMASNAFGCRTIYFNLLPIFSKFGGFEGPSFMTLFSSISVKLGALMTSPTAYTNNKLFYIHDNLTRLHYS